MDSDEDVDWVGIAAAVEEAEAEEATPLVVEAATIASAPNPATKRKRPYDSDNNDHQQQDIPPVFNLADVDPDPGTRKQIEEYATPEIRDQMRRAYLSKGVGHLYGSFSCIEEPSRASTSTTPRSLCKYILKVSFGNWNYGIILWQK